MYPQDSQIQRARVSVGCSYPVAPSGVAHARQTTDPVGSAGAPRRADPDAPVRARPTTRARRHAAPGRQRDRAPRRRREPRGAARQRTPEGAVHGRRVGVPRRRRRRPGGRRGRRPPRGCDTRAARGGGDRDRGPRGARQVLALDHPEGGPDPLRHAFLPRGAARRPGGAGRRGGVRGPRLVHPGSRRWPPTPRGRSCSSSRRSSTSSSSASSPPPTTCSTTRGDARCCRSSRASCVEGEVARILLPGDPGYDGGRRRLRSAAGACDHVRDGVDQRQVREGLRVVAEMAP